jgi:hypothetical protein
VTVTLTRTPEIEEGILAKARARGMALEEYVQNIVEQDALPLAQKKTVAEPTPREEAVRRMLEFGERYRLSLGESISREILREGHRF